MTDNKKEVIYQFYPTTWLDLDMNAFKAMKEHLARIEGLGVSTIWLAKELVLYLGYEE